MDLKNWFSNFVGSTSLNNIDNKKLKKYCQNLKESHPGRIISNYKGWQSENLNLQSPIIKNLVSEIEKELSPFKKILDLKEKFTFKVISIWANINTMRDFNIPHIHTFSMLSGVYYVSASKHSGDLRFLNPNLFSFGYLRNESEIFKKYNMYNCNNVFSKPENSKLVIFPSHLLHYVLPNHTKKDRISLSFNCDILENVGHTRDAR